MSFVWIHLEGWNPILQSIRRWVRRASKWWRHLPVLFRRRTTWRAERCRHVRKFCSAKSRFTYTVVITQLTHILSTWLVSWTEKLDKIHRRNPLRPRADWVRSFSWWFDHGGSFYSPVSQSNQTWNNEIKVKMNRDKSNTLTFQMLTRGVLRSYGKLGDLTVNFLLKSGLVEMGTRIVPLYVSADLSLLKQKLIFSLVFYQIRVGPTDWFSCCCIAHCRHRRGNFRKKTRQLLRLKSASGNCWNSNCSRGRLWFANCENRWWWPVASTRDCPLLSIRQLL